MHLRSLKSKLAVAAPLALVAVFGTSHMAIAQPAGGAGKAGKRGAKGGMSKKAMAKIETALGKPLTADQKKQLNDAAKARREAVKEATDKFNAEVARVTGLTLDKVEDLSKPEKKNP